MPNWCENHVHFYHSNPKMIEAIKKSPEKGGLFTAFFPIKAQDKGFYYKAIEEWGTKWDVDEFPVIDSGDNHIVIGFPTAWSPPIEFYEKMLGLEFKIDALFHEAGVGLLGRFVDGIEENYPYPQTHEDYQNLPDEFDQAFGLYQFWIEEGIEEYASIL